MIDYLPSRFAADNLVAQYYKAVYPVARILHWPSFQTTYESFWGNVTMGIEPSGSQQAIVFAVFFSAVVSYAEDDAYNLFGVKQKSMIETFQAGTEMALSRANFLRTTRVSVLQALVVYMASCLPCTPSNLH